MVVVVRQVSAGTAVLVLAVLAVAVVVPDTSPAGRVAIVAGVTGVLAAVLSDWRARVAVTGIAIVLFVGVLAGQYGARSWHFTPLVVLAAALGAGYRRLADGPDGYSPE